MKTLKQPPATHQVVEYTNTSGSTIASGAVVLFAGGVAFANAEILNGAKGGIVVGGQVEVTKATGQAWTAGNKIYWAAGAANFTTTAAGNTLAGFAVRAQASGDTKGLLFIAEPPGT